MTNRNNIMASINDDYAEAKQSNEIEIEIEIFHQNATTTHSIN